MARVTLTADVESVKLHPGERTRVTITATGDTHDLLGTIRFSTHGGGAHVDIPVDVIGAPATITFDDPTVHPNDLPVTVTTVSVVGNVAVYEISA